MTVLPAALTFTAANWNDAQTVDVHAAEDADLEHDAATVQHTVSGGDYGANSVTAADVSVSVTDNETPSTKVTLAANPETVAEDVGAGGQVVTVTATLNAAPRTAATEVTVSVAAGTAAAADFAPVSNFTLTIDAATTSGTASFTLQPVDDTLSEHGETVAVSGSAPDLTVIGTTVTITDDEATPTVTLALGAESIGENGDETPVTATLDHASSADTTITVHATPVPPATGGDFTQSGTTLTITAGSTTSTGMVTIAAVNDEESGPNKQVTVSGTAGNDVGVAGPADVTLTITDDDDPAVTVSFARVELHGDGGWRCGSGRGNARAGIRNATW